MRIKCTENKWSVTIVNVHIFTKAIALESTLTFQFPNKNLNYDI